MVGMIKRYGNVLFYNILFLKVQNFVLGCIVMVFDTIMNMVFLGLINWTLFKGFHSYNKTNLLCEDVNLYKSIKKNVDIRCRNMNIYENTYLNQVYFKQLTFSTPE